MPLRTAFISHAHTDNQKCDPYVEALQKRGISLYYDRANPQLGHDLGVALEQELERANALIVMVTPAALASFWVREEISMFFALMSQDPSRLLIPVLLQPCDLPPRLAARWWVDAIKQTLPQVIDQLVKALDVVSPSDDLPTAPGPAQRPRVANGARQPVELPSLAPTQPSMQPKSVPPYPAATFPQATTASDKPPIMSLPTLAASPSGGSALRASVAQADSRSWMTLATRQRRQRSIIAGVVAAALLVGMLGWLVWSQLPAVTGSTLTGSNCTTNAQTGLGGTPAAFGGPSAVSGNLVTLDQCLQYIDIHNGGVDAPATVKVGDNISIEYTGWLTNGTQFASVPAFGVSFTVGQGQVIAGLDKGVVGMQPGGERRLIIPPALGYGAHGYGGEGTGSAVPPNATLIMDVFVE